MVEDETDVQAAKQLKAEVVHENEEFDEMQMKLDLQFLKYYPTRADYTPLYSTLNKPKER